MREGSHDKIIQISYIYISVSHSNRCGFFFSKGKLNLVNFTLTLSMVKMSQFLLILFSIHKINRKQSKFCCYIRIKNVPIPLNPSFFRGFTHTNSQCITFMFVGVLATISIMLPKYKLVFCPTPYKEYINDKCPI